jgi:para-nitrobenzyl esterase
MSEPIANTTLGQVRGTEVRGIRVFQGIPYGAPTDGENRCRPPKSAQPWNGVRNAIVFGPSSPQMMGPVASAMPRPPRMDLFGLADPPDINQSEDCLVLNVWTPALADGGRRPVLFRIHGGGFGAGSGSWNWHDGTNVARRGDAVVVTVNHRLSPLGYVFLDEIGGPDWAGSGNAGMLDLVLALEWVRENAEAFGGDPNRVMIFGESGGGAKVSTLLAMPQAEGLFHRAVIQSGPVLDVKTRDEATGYAESYLAELEVSAKHLNRLAALPMQQLLDAHLRMATKAGGPQMAMMLLWPVVDGQVLPAQPGDSIAAGASSKIPLLIGYTRHELFMASATEEPPNLDETQLRAFLNSVIPDRMDEVIETFRHTNPGASPSELAAIISTQAGSGLHSIELARRKITGGAAPVYMYLLTWRSPVAPELGTPHGMCVPLTMDNIHSAQWSNVHEAQPLAARMSQAWINFGAKGDPNHPDIPIWAPYSTNERSTMIFDDPCLAVNDPFGGERALLQEILSFPS